MARIIISAGHTNKDPGTVVSGIREVDLTRKIAKEVVALLRAENFVTLSVPPELDLARRISWINQTGYSEANKDISIEKMYLEKLQGEKFVPKFYFSGNGYVVREKVDGELIGDFLNRAKKREIEIVLNKILEVTLRMDELGINKKEMTNPYKHIYVVNKNNDFHIKMIDYERCIFTEKPKNTTQFLQYIRKNIELLKSKKIVLSEEKIFLISKEIKKRLETGEERKETKKEVGAVQLSDLI